MRDAVDALPIVAGAFQARDLGTNFVVENFRAAAGDGSEARVLEAKNDVFDAQFADFRDAQNFRRGEAVKMNRGIALLDGAQKIFVILDLQIGMQAALEENSVAAELEHLFDLPINFLEREDVTLFGAERAIERAEGTILGAEIRVVDVAVDLVGGDARVGLLQAHLVCLHADAEQVIGFEHVEGLLFGQSHTDSFRPTILTEERFGLEIRSGRNPRRGR